MERMIGRPDPQVAVEDEEGVLHDCDDDLAVAPVFL